jgi:hypothetical protein
MIKLLLKLKSFDARRLGVLLSIVLGALAPAPAFASDKVNEKPVVADTPEKFAIVVDEVRTAMKPGGRYEFIRPDNRIKAEADIEKIGSLLQRWGSVETMSQDQRVQLFNVQENLNGILTHSDSNRLVCEHRAPVGTNIPVTTCQTFGEVEKSHRDAQQYLRDHARDAGINSAALNRIVGDNAKGAH